MIEQDITAQILTHHAALTSVVALHCASDDYARSLARSAANTEQRARWLCEWYCDDGRPARALPALVTDYLRQRVDWDAVATATHKAARSIENNR